MRIQRLLTDVSFLIILGGTALVWTPDCAWAQMFGNRQVGRPLARQNPPGFEQSMEDVGTLQGNERFLRQNRRATDFVGPDLRELQRFIGALQATARGRVAPAMEGLRRRVDRSDTINQPLPPAPRGQMYNPQLVVDFTEFAPSQSSLESSALDTLARSPRMSGSSRIAVSVVERTAILRGEVPSAAERDLAEVLLAFEPGISQVRNELEVVPDLTPSAQSLQALREMKLPHQAWTLMSHDSAESSRERATQLDSRR